MSDKTTCGVPGCERCRRNKRSRMSDRCSHPGCRRKATCTVWTVPPVYVTQLLGTQPTATKYCAEHVPAEAK